VLGRREAPPLNLGDCITADLQQSLLAELATLEDNMPTRIPATAVRTAALAGCRCCSPGDIQPERAIQVGQDYCWSLQLGRIAADWCSFGTGGARVT